MHDRLHEIAGARPGDWGSEWGHGWGGDWDAHRQGRRRRGRQEGSARILSLSVILDAALSVLDHEGLQAVTMRRVGEQLGTGGASLYAHVANKETMLALLVDRVFGEVDLGPAPDPQAWEDQVKSLIRSLRAALIAHRDLAQVNFGAIPAGPALLAVSERILAVMAAGTIPDPVAVHGLDLLTLYATSTAREDAWWASAGAHGAGPGDDPHQAAQAAHRSLAALYTGLPTDRFPRTVALATLLATPGSGADRFDFGLDVLVRGIADHAAG